MVSARYFVAMFILVSAGVCFAQQNTTTCTLEDGRQIYIRFNSASTKTDHPANGRPWTPGGTAMTLFTEAPLTFGGASIPLGAYSVYPFPDRSRWSLAVNKNVTPGAAYDEKENIARAPIETDQIPQSGDALEVAFAHVGNKCTLRIVFGKAASFAEFTAK